MRQSLTSPLAKVNGVIKSAPALRQGDKALLLHVVSAGVETTFPQPPADLPSSIQEVLRKNADVVDELAASLELVPVIFPGKTQLTHHKAWPHSTLGQGKLSFNSLLFVHHHMEVTWRLQSAQLLQHYIPSMETSEVYP